MEEGTTYIVAKEDGRTIGATNPNTGTGINIASLVVNEGNIMKMLNAISDLINLTFGHSRDVTERRQLLRGC